MAAAGKLSERTPEASDGAPPEDSLADTGLDYECGAAHIYEDVQLGETEDNYKALKNYEQLFKSIGLKTKSRFSCNPGITSSMISDTKYQRRISVFLIVAGDRHDPNDPNELATKLDDVLLAMSEKYHPDTPKLLIFCRLIDPDDPLFDVATKEASDIKSRSEEDWKRDHPNVALIYKRGDCNNMSAFLTNLKDEIEHRDEPDDSSKCAPVKYIVEKLTSNNTKKDFYHKGLSDNSDLRIEAFRFEDRLLKNHPMFKNKPRFSPLPVSDMDACYENSGYGKVLIISNERFARQSRRRGTRTDCENLAHLFHRLGFAEASINVKHDLKASDMRQAVEDFCQEDCGSCAVIIILTHGSENRLYGVEEETGKTPNWIAIEEVINMLSASSELSKKPKLLIVNACRDPAAPSNTPKASGTDSVRIDESKKKYASYYLGSRSAIITDHAPGRAGLIVAYSTLPGEKSFGLAYSGSKFISSLCWVFHQHAGQEDVLTMISKVNDHMTSFKEEGVNSDTENSEETQMQLPSWLVETTRKFYLVKVVPAFDRSQADMKEELQCSLASLGCRFTTNETRELASHYEDAADTHRMLCGQWLEKYSRRKDELLKEKMENSKLRDEVAKQNMEENSKLQDEIDSREK